MAPRKKPGATAPKTPSSVLNKMDMPPTLAHPNETLVKHNATHSSEMLVTTDEQSVRLELKVLKNDWPALCYVLRGADGSRILDLMYLALSISGEKDLSFSGSERLAIDNAVKHGSADTIKQRCVALRTFSKKLSEMVEPQDAGKEPAAVPKPVHEADAGDHVKQLPPAGQKPQENIAEPVSETPTPAPESDTAKATEMSDEERRQRNRETLKRNMAKNAQLFSQPLENSQSAEQKPQENIAEPVSEMPAPAPESDTAKATEMSDEERRQRNRETLKRNMAKNAQLFSQPLGKDS